MSRRRVLGTFGALATLGLASLRAPAATGARGLDAAFAAREFQAALAALGGMPRPSDGIRLEVPDVVEDGAAVPVTVSSTLPGTRELLILVEGNPQPLAAQFGVPTGTQPFAAVRIRLAQTCTVYAAVHADAGWHAVGRAVQVTVGGCG